MLQTARTLRTESWWRQLMGILCKFIRPLILWYVHMRRDPLYCHWLQWLSHVFCILLCAVGHVVLTKGLWDYERSLRFVPQHTWNRLADYNGLAYRQLLWKSHGLWDHIDLNVCGWATCIQIRWPNIAQCWGCKSSWTWDPTPTTRVGVDVQLVIEIYFHLILSCSSQFDKRSSRETNIFYKF